MKVLLLEDDAKLAEWVARSLREAGHVVDHVENGKDALLSATADAYDILILDRMVPELDGLSVLKSLRAARNHTPALLLTALSDVDDRVEGLEGGADDYLTKPFAQAELLARVMALGRRHSAEPETEGGKLTYKDLTLDLWAQKCTRAGQKIELNPKEIRLLEALMRAKGRVQTRAMLLEKVWNISFDPSTNVVDTHISRLRAKLDRPFEEQYVRTLRGAGYVIGD